MDIRFIESNPFYILEADPRDNRKQIAQKAEDRAFFLEDTLVEEAQVCLLMPAKRLTAELDWFCECTQTDIYTIRRCICQKKQIAAESLHGISRLNALLYNLMICGTEDSTVLSHIVLEIDNLYKLDVESLTESINECHKCAGMLPVTEENVRKELNKKRGRIQKIIEEKFKSLSCAGYQKLVCLIAVLGLKDTKYADMPIIMDLLDQYELAMQYRIETLSQDIRETISKIRTPENRWHIEKLVTELIQQIHRWYEIVQPLHRRASVNGGVYKESAQLGGDVGELAIWLSAGVGLPNESLLLLEETVNCFSEFPNLLKIFQDMITTTRAALPAKSAEQIVEEKTKALENDIIKWKHDQFITKEILEETLRRVHALNDMLRKNPDESNQRRLVYKMVHDGLDYLRLNQKDLAVYLAQALLSEFGDLDDMYNSLYEEAEEIMYGL